MKRLARSVRRLSAVERLAAAEACALAPAAALAARLLSPDRAVQLFKRRGVRTTHGISPARLGTIADAVLTAAGVRCYTKALVLQYMLARRGVSSDLVLGVATEVGRLHAHAWLESDGEILIGAGARTYTPLWRGDARASAGA